MHSKSMIVIFSCFRIVAMVDGKRVGCIVENEDREDTGYFPVA